MDIKSATRTLILAVASGSFTLGAFAQWQWVDKDGRKVFSDRAPPAEILPKNILKQPGNTAPAPAAALALPSGTDSTLAASPPAAQTSTPALKPSTPKLSGKDAELEARKKQADEAEKAKKAAEDEKLAKAKADNCERATKGLVTIKSGIRLAVTNAKGEREIMDDTGRASETKRLQAIADTDCTK